MWCLTLRNENQKQILFDYAQRQSIRTAVIGPKESYDSGADHWHAFIRFNDGRAGRQWRGIFDGELNDMWIRPLRTIGQEGIQTARRNYIRYCTKEGQPDYAKGIDIHNELGDREPTDDEIAIQQSEDEEPSFEPPRKKTKTSDLIRDAIMQGEKPLDLYRQFPGCIPMIRNLLPLHVNKYDCDIDIK